MKSKFYKRPRYLTLFYGCIFLSFLVWLYVLWVSHKSFDENDFTGYSQSFVLEGWEDEDGQSIEVPHDYEVTPGETFWIQKTFHEDLESEKWLLFRTDHTFVSAYKNHKQVYQFGKQEEVPFGKSPGSGWQLVPLERVKKGDTIKIGLNCPYEKYSGLVRNIRIGGKAELISYVLWKGMGMLLITFIPFLIGIIVILLPPFFFREYSFGIFFNIGVSFIIVSLWSFTEARVWQLFFTNAYGMQMLNFLTFSLFPPGVLLALYTMGFIPDIKIYRRMMAMNVLAALLMLVLQLTNLVDYFNSIVIIHILVIIDSIICVSIFTPYLNKRKGGGRRLALLLYGIICFSSSLDLLDFYVWDRFGNGFFARIEIFICLIFLGIITMKRALNMHMENIEKKAYAKMAYTDTLTLLRNRRGFDEDIKEIEDKKKNVSILFADMNGLKIINDNLGHHLGDSAIQTVANELESLFEQDATCYRVGGDEFYILSFTMEPKEMDKRCKHMNEQLKVYEKQYLSPISISYGSIKYVVGSGMSIHHCLIATDQKMYEHKQDVHQQWDKVPE